MRKSLITTAILTALVAPSFAFAEDAAPAPDLTVAYNVGIYSQYIFRGLTQTNRSPALQGGVDLTHSSGFYLGAWGSNISWLTDENQINTDSVSSYKSGGSVEIDLYGGYRYTFANIGSGLGIDVGLLQYYYPGEVTKGKSAAGNNVYGMHSADTTEVYGALSYGWAQAKISGIVNSTAWGSASAKTHGDQQGTYYAELNLTPPISDMLGIKDGLASGISGIAHIARQEFKDEIIGVNSRATNASYTDYKIGLQKAFSNGVNVGAYWTKAETDANNWTIAGRNIGDDTGTAYIQKTF